MSANPRDVIARQLWAEQKDVDAFLSALSAAGWVVVPLDLPKHMRLAGLAEKKRGHSMPQIWRAMMAAHFAEQDRAKVNLAMIAAAQEDKR